ncbi:MAG: MFS transporter [Synergistaceae bacterium]|nr:MFS transporter [Synergistaceae bacterium]
MNNNQGRLTLAVISLFLLLQGAAVVSPTLQSIQSIYPDIPYTTIMNVITLPCLFIIPFNLLAGVVAGKKVGYRTLAIVSMLLFLAAGTAPYFNGGFTFLMVSRAFVGIALGLMYPLGNSLIVLLYAEEKRAGVMGLGTVALNLGLMVLQNASGILATISVKYLWLSHLLIVLPLLVVLLWLREPETDTAGAKQGAGGVIREKEKTKMPAMVYIVALFIFMFIIFFMAYSTGASAVIVGEGMGSSATVGLVMTVFGVAGMCIGFLYGKIFQLAKGFTIYIGFLVSAAAFFIFARGSALIHYYIGSLILGVGFNIIYASLFMALNSLTPPDKISLSSAISIAALNLGSVASPFYFKILARVTGNSTMRFALYASMTGYLLMIVLHAFFGKKMAKKN